MKSIIFFQILFLGVVVNPNIFAQEGNTIVFNYDKAGNLIERKLQVFALGRFSKPKLPEKDSVELAQNFRIFPNPAYNTINVDGELPSPYTQAKMEIFTVSGQAVIKDYYYGATKNVDVSQLKNGVYLLVISYSDRDRETYKIIVNN